MTKIKTDPTKYTLNQPSSETVTLCFLFFILNYLMVPSPTEGLFHRMLSTGTVKARLLDRVEKHSNKWLLSLA